MASFGVYIGNDPADVTKFENWFGEPVGHIMHYINQWNWQAFDDSINWAANLWTDTDRPVLWSVPLIVPIPDSCCAVGLAHRTAQTRN
jgi:hypothetical protein